jgi:ParB/RepB/Spo0J family partition protein
MATAYPEFPTQHSPLTSLAPWAKQPRQIGRDLADADLEASIRVQGVMTPLIVRPSKSGPPYEIITGERRWRAAKALGLETVPVIVRALSDTEAREVALIENVQRRDMNVVDEARAYAALRDSKPPKTVPAIAAAVGKTEHHVYRTLKLLTLEKPLLEALASGALSIAHAELLLQLDTKRRAEAVDTRGRGVVWSRSPLLDDGEKWTPSAEDLQPIHELRKFARAKATFDPLAEDTRHFQPDLAQQLEDATAPDDSQVSEAEGERQVEAARAHVVNLSDDPMVRSRLGAAANDKHVPLNPNHWKEIKKPVDRCEFAQTGVIVHGGPARVLDVCVTRRCQKHWPKPKKVKPASGAAGKQVSASKPQETWEQQNARHAAERQAINDRWAQVLPEAKRLILNHTAALTVQVPFVGTLLNDVDTWNGLYSTGEIKSNFGVTLTSSNLAQVLALSVITIDDRESFAKTTKPWRFDMKPIDAALAKLTAAEKASARAKAKPAKKKNAGKKTKKGKAA